MKRIPTNCPSCDDELKVKKLICNKCDTEIEGLFDLPPLAKLSIQDQDFVLQFVKASGSLKEMARLLKLSYPTVRNRLNDVIDRCKQLDNDAQNNGK